VEKAKIAGGSTCGITNTVLCQFKESQPQLHCNLYSHYIKTNKTFQIISIDRAAQQMLLIDSKTAGATSSKCINKSQKGGQPKGSTNDNIVQLATQGKESCSSGV